MMREKTIARTTLYRVYIVDGVYFLETFRDDPTKPVAGYDTLEGIAEALYYQGFSDSKNKLPDISIKK